MQCHQFLMFVTVFRRPTIVQTEVLLKTVTQDMQGLRLSHSSFRKSIEGPQFAAESF